jgi:ASC-1-like (ASCH) protein
MKTITKKIDTEWFELILAGKKKYELRLADFDIEEGDILRLE